MSIKNISGLIVGFYISKFDTIAYKNLGYGSVTLTHKRVGQILGIKGTTIQNMRDEFDPLHTNPRKGWHQRELTPSRQNIVDQYDHFSEPELRKIVKNILSKPSLPKTAENSKKDWSDEELQIAVSSYLYMLELQIAGISFPVSEVTKVLINGPLRQRNEASIRYRMRNISDVLLQSKRPFLKTYSPASQVGTKVRQRIVEILDKQLHKWPHISGKTNKNIPISLTSSEILEKLTNLENKLDQFTAPKIKGLGHNNPPEPTENEFSDVTEAKQSLQKIRKELVSNTISKKRIENEKNVILKLGLKFAIWTGSQLSKLSNVAFIAMMGAIGGGIGKELLPQIIDTMKYLLNFLHL